MNGLKPNRHAQRAMTLLELMVAMSLLTIIILGLYKMFDRTQQIMRDGVREVDFAEAGRLANGLMLKDLQQIYPSGQSVSQTNVTNFYVQPVSLNSATPMAPAAQLLVDNTLRQHELQEFYLLSKAKAWHGIGYFIAPPQPPTQGDLELFQAGVGTLYRVEFSTNTLHTNLNDMYALYKNPPVSDIQQVVDGVIHMRIRAYTNGILVGTNGIPEIDFALTNRTIPSHVDLEFGLLDRKSLQEARGIPGTIGTSNLLYRYANRVQMYRTRLPIPAGNLPLPDQL